MKRLLRILCYRLRALLYLHNMFSGARIESGCKFFNPGKIFFNGYVSIGENSFLSAAGGG